MITRITSNTNEKIKELYKKTRDSKFQLFVIESMNLIKELVAKKETFENILVTQNFLDKNKWIKEQENVIVVTENIIQKIAFANNPPECLCIKKLNIPSFKISNENYLILDSIKDPGNLATIIRTAVAFNVCKIFISSDSVSVYNDKVLRSTMGTIFEIKILYYKDILDIVRELEKHKIECVATCLDEQAIPLHQYQPKAKNVAIIMGNESHGLDTNFLKVAKHKCYIEISNTNSLNVACASAIMLYQLSLWNK